MHNNAARLSAVSSIAVEADFGGNASVGEH